METIDLNVTTHGQRGKIAYLQIMFISLGIHAEINRICVDSNHPFCICELKPTKLWIKTNYSSIGKKCYLGTR